LKHCHSVTLERWQESGTLFYYNLLLQALQNEEKSWEKENNVVISLL
jgi:hypothetical protein